MKNIHDTWLYVQLKKVYGEAALTIYESENQPDNPTQCLLPVEEGHHTLGWIGIEDNLVGSDAKALLYTIVDCQNNKKESVISEEERFWRLVVHKDISTWERHWSKYSSAKERYGQVYLIMDGMDGQEVIENQDWYHTLKEMIEEMTEKESYFFPVNDYTYTWIIPDYEQLKNDMKSLILGLVGTITSELLVKPRFLIGRSFQMPMNVKEKIEEELHFLQHSASFPWEEQMASLKDLFPYVILGQANPDSIKIALDELLADVRDDHELLYTVQVFLKQNLNVSETAKKLFIHRNSMQYRLDKFNEKTGLDVRKFTDAQKAFLAISALGTMNKK